MSKRNTKQAMYQPRSPQPKRRTPAGKPASKADRASGARSSTSRPAPAAQRGSARADANMLLVRIAAIAVVVAAIAGGTAWAISLKGAYGTAELVGLIVLGFLAGLGLAVALRTEQVVTQVSRILRERQRR